MLGENLVKLKQFEKILKQCLLKRFGAFLPENKISLLNNTEYVIGNEFADGMDKLTFQGNTLRHMLDSIIDIACLKEISLDGINSSTLVYGRELEDGIIELYTQELARLFKLNVNKIPELDEYVNLANKLIEVYGERLDERIFTENAGKLLNLPALKEVADACDTIAVKKYLEKNKQVADSVEDKDKDNKLFNGITSRKGSIQIIYLDEKKYIKYIDNNGKIHLVQAHNSEKVSDFYREKIENLKPDEQLDPEEFFNELCKIAEEETMTESDEINFDEINFNEQNMIKFVDSSEKLGKETVENVQDKHTITHSNDGKIHAINGTNDVVYTDNKGEHIEANIVKDGQNYADENTSQQNTDISNRVLSEEEYTELCMRYANNEQLTPEELDALMKSTPELMEEAGPILSMNTSKKKRVGFANKTILIYILMIVAFIGVFIGAMIYSLTN